MLGADVTEGQGDRVLALLERIADRLDDASRRNGPRPGDIMRLTYGGSPDAVRAVCISNDGTRIRFREVTGLRDMPLAELIPQPWSRDTVTWRRPTLADGFGESP